MTENRSRWVKHLTTVFEAFAFTLCALCSIWVFSKSPSPNKNSFHFYIYAIAILLFFTGRLFKRRVRGDIFPLTLYGLSIALSVISARINSDCEYSGGYSAADGECAWE